VLASFSTASLWCPVDLLALCSISGHLTVDGVRDGVTKWKIKCFRAFSEVDGGGSGVGFGDAAAKLVVLNGGPGKVVGGPRLGRLVCSFLVKDGDLVFPSVGLLSWLLLVAAAMDFLRVVDSFNGAGSYILVGVWLVFAAGILGGGGLFFRSPVLLLATADLLLLFLALDDDGRCDWEAIYSASVPSSKSSAVSSTSWGSRRVSWASCSLREDPRTLLSNLSGLRVLYANLHLWTMGIMDYVVKFFSSRVLVVKAQLL